MKSQTTKKLLKLNYNLYEKEASSWDKTRSDIWEKTVTDFIAKIKPGSSILDLGCGNARLYEAISKIKNQESKINYLGIDPSKKLIEINKKKYCHHEEIKNRCGDHDLKDCHAMCNMTRNDKQCHSESFDRHSEQSEESQSDLSASLKMTALFKVGDGLTLKDKNKYDYVFCLAVLHHIPSKILQLKFLKNIYLALRPKGKALISVWNRWQPKYEPYMQDKKLYEDMEKTDTIVPWRKTKHCRFVHCFTKNELENLAKITDFKNIKVFYADKKNITDKENGLNIYLVCKK